MGLKVFLLLTTAYFKLGMLSVILDYQESEHRHLIQNIDLLKVKIIIIICKLSGTIISHNVLSN